ncbi:MAG: MobF family relaxase [Pirellulaceae bacterium]|nr:relaxase domain-containing protein [Planctomycetales bacterium]
MLRITVISSPDNAERYYSAADYYLDEEAVPARWHGQGAERLGLHGELVFDHFSALCRNRHPLTGKQITAAHRDNRRVGYDITFSVSKSVSILYALAGDERILKAFQQSVQDTMQLIEQDAAVRLRKDGANSDRLVGNLVYSDFYHSLSRPTGQDNVPQPQLHAHVVVQNMAFDSEEGIWKALQAGGIKASAPYFQAAFRAKLAERIQQLGYEIDVNDNDFEIRGIPDRVIKAFSKRTEEVEQLARMLANEQGVAQLSADAKAKLGATSRRNKVKHLDWQQLKDHWHSEISHADIQAVHFTHEDARKQLGNFQDRSAAAFQLALDHLLERHSVVSERQLIAETLRRGLGAVRLDSARQQLQRTDLLKAVYDGTPMVTTRQAMDEEKELIAVAKRGMGVMRPIGTISETDLSDLNAGQKAAVRHLLSTRDRFALVSGRAGVGKTTMLVATKDAMEQAGKRVTVLAPTSSAARGTLRSDGVATAETLQRFIVDRQMQLRAAGQQVLVDEASLAGIKDLLALSRLAERHDFRVAYIGDARQHKSVGRGHILKVLEDFGGVRPVNVHDILRQTGEYKKTVELLAEGKAEEAFDRLDKQGAIRTDGYEALARTFVEHLQRGRTITVVSPTHAEGAVVAQHIRAQLKEANLIADDDRLFSRLVDLQTTEADRMDPNQDYTGMTAQFVRNKGPFRAGQRFLVEHDTQDVLRQFATAYRLYRTETFPVAVNERLRVTSGGRTLCGHRLETGSSYTVKSFTRDGNIILKNGWEVSKEFQHLSQDYVVTSFAAQSRTTDSVLVAMGSVSFPAVNATSFYVSLSRGKLSGQALVFTDDPAGLRKAVTRPDEKLTASETVGRPSRRSRLKHRLQHFVRVSRHKLGSVRSAIKPKELDHGDTSTQGLAR